MKLGRMTRLIVESFPEQKKWIGKLLYPINDLITKMFTALNNNLTFQDNMLASVKNFTITGGETWSFINPLQVKPIGVILLHIRSKDYPNVDLTDGITVYWNYTNQNKIDTLISNLTPNERYNITLLIIGG